MSSVRLVSSCLSLTNLVGQYRCRRSVLYSDRLIFPSTKLCRDHTSLFRNYAKRVGSIRASSKEEAPKPSPKMKLPSWIKWVVGSVLTLLVPLWKQQWTKFLMIEEKAEVVVHEAEVIAEAVEEAANVAAKAAAEVADEQQEGRLKEAALFVEGVSKATARDAHVAKEIIEKVEEIEHEFDDVVKGDKKD